MTKLVKPFSYFTLTFLSIGVLSQYMHLLMSDTDSLPQHYFLQFPLIKPQKNDYTVVWSPWYKGKIIKKVLGVAGDKVWTDNNGQLWLNTHKVVMPKKLATDGRELNALPSQIIPEGFVFLYSEHSDSFDSRYTQLGFIPLSQLQGLVVPLW